MIKRIDLEPTEEIITESLKDGTFIRMEDVQNFLSLLQDTEPPYVWCIDASWGDGKTFFVKAMQTVLECNNPWIKQSSNLQILGQSLDENLKVEGDSFLPIYFNAWENDTLDSPLCALAASIATEFEEHVNTDSKPVLDKAAAIIDTAVACIPYHPHLDIKGLKEAFTGESFIEEAKKRHKLEKEVDQLIKVVCEKRANKAVLFIDELDRCRPEFAIKLLSDIKILFNNDQLIIVYSMDVTQLSNALEGFYGSSFDTQKYLERFYDRKIMLSKISKNEYLDKVNLFLNHTTVYDDIVNALINRNQLTMRDMNRLAKFNEAKSFIYRQNADGNPKIDFVISFANCALLPILIAIEYFEPGIWKQILNGDNFEIIYSYAQDILPFTDMLDSAISHVYHTNIAITDEIRIDFIMNLCSMIFLYSDRSSERRNKAFDIFGNFIDNRLNKEVFRTLSFSKWQ